MQYLLLRLEAPLMAFGGPMVDAIGPTRRFPGQAQIAGLLGNALGYSHHDARLLDDLQDRLRMAAAVPAPSAPQGAGERLRDYQTVFLGRPHLVETGWTTRGAVEKRAGASSRETHIRQRWHVADSCVLLALTLAPADAAPTLHDLAAAPTLHDLAAAVEYPARPLFIGRKPCLPTAPILLDLVTAGTAADALREGAALLASRGHPGFAPDQTIDVELEERLDDETAIPDAHRQTERLLDGRDWRNQLHTRARAVRRYSLRLRSEP